MFALFLEKGVYGTEYSLRIGGDVREIVNQLAYKNDWSCLVNMGRSMGPKNDQPKLDKLEKFLSTCKDRKTLEKFRIKISTGEVGCVMCAETEEELEKMRKFVLSAQGIDPKHHSKLNGLFDRLIASLNSEEGAQCLYRKISDRQFIDSGIARDDYLD